MNTLMIDKLLVNQPNFIGAYPCDKIPKVSKSNYSMIVNTDNSSQDGEHWTAFIIKGETVYYMDSFGRNFDNKSFPIDYNINISRLFLGKRILFNDKVLQGFQNNTCGEYCIYFIARFNENIPFSNIFRDFSRNLNSNDQKIFKIVKSM